MTADIVNLRQARKRKARAEKEVFAEQNRRTHGQSKAIRRHDAATKSLDDRRLDGARRVRDEPESAD